MAASFRVVKTALALVAFVTILNSDTLVWEIRAPRLLDRAVLVAPEGFSLKSVEEKSAAFANENRGKYSIVRLTLAPDRLILMRALYKGPPDTTFESLSAGIKRVGLPTGPVARLLTIGDASVLTYRDPNGYTEKLLSGQQDPRVIRVQGTDSQLLHFRVTEMRHNPPAPREYVATFFVEMRGDLSAAVCVAITRHLAALSGLPYSTVAVRGIPWFIEDTGFPDVFPFVSTISVPSKEEYQLLPSVRCSNHPVQGLHCSGQHFVP